MWPRFLPLPSTLILIAGTVWLGFTYTETQNSAPLETALEPLQSVEDLTNTPAEFARQFKPDVYYQAITERPLFSATRRPISTDPIEEVVVEKIVEAPAIIEPELIIEEEPVSFSLHGTMESGGNTLALVGVDGHPPEWIRENALISGWTLSEITSELIEFHKDTEVIRVYLYEDGR